MKINNIDGEIVKDNDTYTLKDNTSLNNLVVSTTTLHPGKSTNGHSHPGKEEVYMIMSGSGRMQLDNDEFDISGGETLRIILTGINTSVRWESDLGQALQDAIPQDIYNNLALII